MRKLCLVATVLVCSCSKGTRVGGLVAKVTLLDHARASCIVGTVSDTSGKKLDATSVATGTKRMLSIGIGSAGYPRDVVISVAPQWSATGCTDAKPHGAAVEHPGHFPDVATEDVLFELGPPDVSLDADG